MPPPALRLLRKVIKNAIFWTGHTLEWWRDRRRGVETRRTGKDGALMAVGENLAYAEGYQPTPWRDIRAALRGLRIDPSEFTFVDLGSGKGRTLFAAAELPFRRIVGVEFDPDLHAVCKRNLASFRSRGLRCTDIQPVLADAAAYDFPDDNLVVFMFNPFSYPPLIEVVDRLRAQHRRTARKIVVVYYNAKYGDILQRASFLRQIYLEPPLFYFGFRPWWPTAVFESV